MVVEEEDGAARRSCFEERLRLSPYPPTPGTRVNTQRERRRRRLLCPRQKGTCATFHRGCHWPRNIIAGGTAANSHRSGAPTPRASTSRRSRCLNVPKLLRTFRQVPLAASQRSEGCLFTAPSRAGFLARGTRGFLSLHRDWPSSCSPRWQAKERERKTPFIPNLIVAKRLPLAAASSAWKLLLILVVGPSQREGREKFLFFIAINNSRDEKKNRCCYSRLPP